MLEARDVTKRFGEAQQRVGRDSKGMRQKGGLAIATVRDATTLLLDEPMSGLGPGAGSEFTQ